MTIAVTIGRWGGLYFSRGYITRLCLGYIAFDLWPGDYDDKLDFLLAALDERDAFRAEIARLLSEPPPGVRVAELVATGYSRSAAEAIAAEEIRMEVHLAELNRMVNGEQP